MAQRLDRTSTGGSGGAAGTVTEVPGADPAGLPPQTGDGPVPEGPAGSVAAGSLAAALPAAGSPASGGAAPGPLAASGPRGWRRGWRRSRQAAAAVAPVPVADLVRPGAGSARADHDP